jgi:hypothetical protein
VLSWVLSWVLAIALPAHAACGDTLAQPGRALIAADDVQLAFAPSIWPLPVGEPFALQIELCAGRSGEGALPALLQVDADMPAHRHGLNYRLTLRQTGMAAGPDRHLYRAEGLLLHMPGRWRLLFDIGPAQAPRRLVRVLDVD